MAQKIKDDELLVMVLSGRSQVEIARELNLTKATVNRRIRDPSFQSLLSSYRRTILDSTVTQLCNCVGKAVTVLVELLDHDSPTVRLNSAKTILSFAQEYTLQVDLLQEVEKIKAQQEQ